MVETLRVLIVDDELGMQLGAARALRDFRVQVPDVEGEVIFDVSTCGSGEDALRQSSTTPPDLLLLDHKLPGINGLDVLDRLRARDSEPLTIMITAYASLETAVTATKRGAYDFLAKPFTPAELKAVVRKAAARVVLARQARRLAEEKRQVRFQFISVLAHELKAPLGAIEGYLKILQNRTIGDDLTKYDQMIDRSIIRLDGMKKLIFDLLDLTRIESGQKKRDFKTIDLAQAARDAVELFQANANEREIALHLNVDGPIPMQADRTEIDVILNNLISNAIKYNRDGGRVDATIAQSDEVVTITVTDTGIGMTEEEAGRLFNEFVRIKNEKTNKILGTGLGLSILRKLAILYGGDATVTSEPDVGSTFTVTLRRDAVPDEQQPKISQTDLMTQ